MQFSSLLGNDFITDLNITLSGLLSVTTQWSFMAHILIYIRGMQHIYGTYMYVGNLNLQLSPFEISTF